MCLCDTCLASSFTRVTITVTGLVFLAFKVKIKLERSHILTFEASDINSIVVQDFFLGFETSEPEPVHLTRSRSRSRSRPKMARLRILDFTRSSLMLLPDYTLFLSPGVLLTQWLTPVVPRRFR